MPIYKADNFIAAWTPFGGITPLGRLFSTGVSAKTLLTIAGQIADDHQADLSALEKVIGPQSARAASNVEPEVAEKEVGDDALPAVALAPTVEVHPVIVETEVPASPLSIAAEPETVAVTNDPEPAPATVASKASDKVEIVPGIYERTLPDGRVAFLTGKNDGAGDRLKMACQGIAQWNPRFRNWLTDAARASTIRKTLLTRQKEQAEAAHGAS